MNDIASYKQLDEELDKLQMFLIREKSALEQHKETLDEIRNKK